MATEWYCQLMGSEMGPYSAAQLREMARQHQLTPEDLVRKGADGDWVAGYRVNGLFDEEAPTAAPGPKPPADSLKPKDSPPANKAATGKLKVAAPGFKWFYLSDGKKVGPLRFQQLQNHAQSGQLKASDRVWSTDNPKWSEAGAVDGLTF